MWPEKHCQGEIQGNEWPNAKVTPVLGYLFPRLLCPSQMHPSHWCPLMFTSRLFLFVFLQLPGISNHVPTMGRCYTNTNTYMRIYAHSHSLFSILTSYWNYSGISSKGVKAEQPEGALQGASLAECTSCWVQVIWKMAAMWNRNTAPLWQMFKFVWWPSPSWKESSKTSTSHKANLNSIQTKL